MDNEYNPTEEVVIENPPVPTKKPHSFESVYKVSRRINYLPMDSREYASRYGGHRYNGVSRYDFTKEQIEDIICSGELSQIRELSRYYYRTNSRYRNTINFLAALPLYDTMVSPIYEAGKGSKAQIIKAFYNACSFVEALDVKNTLSRITREWLKSGIYFGILQENSGKVVL